MDWSLARFSSEAYARSAWNTVWICTGSRWSFRFVRLSRMPVRTSSLRHSVMRWSLRLIRMSVHCCCLCSAARHSLRKYSRMARRLQLLFLQCRVIQKRHHLYRQFNRSSLCLRTWLLRISLIYLQYCLRLLRHLRVRVTLCSCCWKQCSQREMVLMERKRKI